MNKNQILCWALCLALTPGVWANASQKNDLTTSYSLRTEVGYDSNVYLQDTGADAKKGSAVIAVTPTATVNWKNSDNSLFSKFVYSPRVEWFVSESSQNNQKHNLSLGLGGKANDVAWAFDNSLLVINGAGDESTQLLSGQLPLAGGVSMRDRNDAIVWRPTLKATYKPDQWLIRPVMEGYFHDFRTAPGAAVNAGYYFENYVDRYDINAGLDVGHKITKDAYVFVGYRLGYMFQGLRPSSTLRYTNDYHRFLMGTEGKFFGGKLTGNLTLGADYRHFSQTVAAGFDRNQVVPYLEGSAAYTIDPNWTFTGKLKRFGLVAFTGGSFYEDYAASGILENKVSDKLSVRGGLNFYQADWAAYTSGRCDTQLQPTVGFTYKASAQLTMDGVYTYETTNLVNPAQEHSRHYVGMGATYKF